MHSQNFLNNTLAGIFTSLLRTSPLVIVLLGATPAIAAAETGSQVQAQAQAHATDDVVISGHHHFRSHARRESPDAFAQLELNSRKATQLREYLAGSILRIARPTRRVDYARHASESVQFCRDGSYIHQIVPKPAMRLSRHPVPPEKPTLIKGYWDAATIDGVQTFWLYSEDHRMRSRFRTTGFLPQIVEHFDHDSVRILHADTSVLHRRIQLPKSARCHTSLIKRATS